MSSPSPHGKESGKPAFALTRVQCDVEDQRLQEEVRSGEAQVLTCVLVNLSLCGRCSSPKGLLQHGCVVAIRKNLQS